MAPVAEPELSRKELFERDGFLVVKGFAPAEELERMRSRMLELIGQWDPEKTMAPVFTTDGDQVERQVGRVRGSRRCRRSSYVAYRLPFQHRINANSKGTLKVDMRRRVRLEIGRRSPAFVIRRRPWQRSTPLPSMFSHVRDFGMWTL